MQGTLTFKDPVNLRINGSFEGVLSTLGSLTVGEKASVNAQITGETIHIAGQVTGDVKALKELHLAESGKLNGNVSTPSLLIEKGAVLQGQVDMKGASKTGSISENRATMGADELASYLAVKKSMIFEWADSGKLPGVREGSAWKFDKDKVDEWVASGRIK
jgi:excisionase family DNA binding protein